MTALPISISRVTRSPRCPTGDASFRERMSQSGHATRTVFYVNPTPRAIKQCAIAGKGAEEGQTTRSIEWICQVFYSILSSFTMSSIHLVEKVTHFLCSALIGLAVAANRLNR